MSLLDLECLVSTFECNVVVAEYLSTCLSREFNTVCAYGLTLSASDDSVSTDVFNLSTYCTFDYEVRSESWIC